MLGFENWYFCRSWICTLATRCSNNETLNHTQIMWLLISLPLKKGHVELHTQIQLGQKLMNPYVSAKSKLIHVILITMGYLWISPTHLLFCFCFESRKSFKSINVTLAKKLWFIHKVIFFSRLFWGGFSGGQIYGGKIYGG